MRADTLLLLRDRAQSGGGLLLPAPAAAALLDLIEAACQLHDAEEVMGEALAISAITDIREAEADIKDALRQLQAAIQSARALPELQPAAQVDPTTIFLEAVAAELRRARQKFPGDRIMTIALAEEFGELAKAMLDECGPAVWKEAVQTAVMAGRVAIDGDSSVDDWRQAKGLDNHRCGYQRRQGADPRILAEAIGYPPKREAGE